ncbi:hypothetical protein [Neoaquamicrobium sediminum]|uniref:hypothetical protein n=1 Tax=Neoaquamicrobium sediminum TaxID=1849104 RepID=UPI003BAA5F9E
MDDLGVITLLNRNDPCWFGHTSGFARQFVDVVTGRAVIPDELRPLIIETTPPGRDVDFDGRALVAACDVVVVEISSIKVNRLDGWDLNLHLVYGAEKSGIHAEILNNTEKSVSSSEQILADLSYIGSAVNRPVVTVDHLHYLDEMGNPLWGRVDITNTLKSAETKLGFPFYSTKDLIEKHGQTVALKDHGHYNGDFEIMVARSMFPLISGAVGCGVISKPMT